MKKIYCRFAEVAMTTLSYIRNLPKQMDFQRIDYRNKYSEVDWRWFQLGLISPMTTVRFCFSLQMPNELNNKVTGKYAAVQTLEAF